MTSSVRPSLDPAGSKRADAQMKIQELSPTPVSSDPDPDELQVTATSAEHAAAAFAAQLSHSVVIGDPAILLGAAATGGGHGILGSAMTRQK